MRLVSPDPAAVGSKWVKHELLYALREKSYEEHIVVIEHQPADDKKLSWTLRNYQWVDFQQGFAAGCRDLLRIWGMGYRGEAFVPESPSDVNRTAPRKGSKT
jgi:hypothetical protein